MGDISELRGLVTCITFLGVAVILITAIPAQFYAGAENREVSIPATMEVSDIYSYAESTIYQTNASGSFYSSDLLYHHFDLGGHNIHLIYKKYNMSGDKFIDVVHQYAEYVVWVTGHDFVVYDQGQRVSENFGYWSEAFKSENMDESVKYQIKCPHGIQIDMQIGWNQTTYATIDDAWDHGEVYIWLGINFDQVNTSYNALSIITMVMFFQFPEDAPVYIKALISIPIYVSFAYIAFILILRTIGAVFGGGGA